MWGIRPFKRKAEAVDEPKVAKFKCGDIVYEPGDYPQSPKVIYMIPQDNKTLFAAEFLVIDDNVMFVKNYCINDSKVIKQDNPVVDEYLTMNWEHYKDKGGFIRNKKKFETDQVAGEVTSHYRLTCSLAGVDPLEWYDLSYEEAQTLYNDLKRAKVNKGIWESTHAVKDRQFIDGSQIVTVLLKPYKNN
jgi:hypothetical protein